MKEFLAFTKYFASFPVLVLPFLIKNSILHISLSPKNQHCLLFVGSYPSSSAPQVLISPPVSQKKKKKSLERHLTDLSRVTGPEWWHILIFRGPHCNHVRSREGYRIQRKRHFCHFPPHPLKDEWYEEERKINLSPQF